MTQTTPPTPEQKAKIQKIMYFNGAMFFVVGTAVLAVPAIGAHLDMDESTTRLVGSVLIFVGVMDFLIARFMFGNKDTK